MKTPRQKALDKFFDDLFRLGLFVLTFTIVGIAVGCLMRVVQELPPLPDHPVHFVGYD